MHSVASRVESIRRGARHGMGVAHTNHAAPQSEHPEQSTRTKNTAFHFAHDQKPKNSCDVTASGVGNPSIDRSRPLLAVA